MTHTVTLNLIRSKHSWSVLTLFWLSAANCWYLGVSFTSNAPASPHHLFHADTWHRLDTSAADNHRNGADVPFELNQSKWSLLNSKHLSRSSGANRERSNAMPISLSSVQVSAVNSRQTARRVCRRLPGLTDAQLKLCESSPSLMTAVSHGAELGAIHDLF
jgi:hypothetical protein